MILFSTMLYALGKELGLEGGNAEWERQLRETSSDSLPVARFLARVRSSRDADEVAVYADMAATSIAKARSRAFHAARNADLWIACDDDVEADTTAIAALMDAVETSLPRIAFLPCYLRGREVVGCKFLPLTGSAPNDDYGRHSVLRRIEHSATCAFVANRAALQLLGRSFEHLRYLDDDGVHRLALFLEVLEQGRWYGEDIAFCQRAALAGIELVAITKGVSSHDGQVLNLAQLRSVL